MIDFIINNLGTIAVCTVIAVAVFLAVAVIIRDRKRGKTGCSGNCACCGFNCQNK